MGTHSTLSLSLVYCRPFASDIYVGHGTEQGVVGAYGGGGGGGGKLGGGGERKKKESQYLLR